MRGGGLTNISRINSLCCCHPNYNGLIRFWIACLTPLYSTLLSFTAPLLFAASWHVLPNAAVCQPTPVF